MQFDAKKHKHEYIKQIGQGAYGVVCLALDHNIKAKVAIKKVLNHSKI